MTKLKSLEKIRQTEVEDIGHRIVKDVDRIKKIIVCIEYDDGNLRQITNIRDLFSFTGILEEIKILNISDNYQ